MVHTEPASGRRGWAIGVLVFTLMALAGLYVAKWQPYYLKAFHAAATHTLGPSIVTGTAASAPPFSWNAALSYAIAYGRAIWVALIVGLLLGAGVQTLLPRDWLLRVLGRTGAKSSAVAGLAAVPSMMCTCCSAPLAVGLARSKVSPGAVLAYWLGNPVLNPATIVFLGFVLGWGWALLRIVVGALLVAAVAWYGNRYVPQDGVQGAAEAALAASAEPAEPSFIAWLRALWRLVIGLVPEYIVIVFVLGALRSALFPMMTPALGQSLLLFLGLALAGTLFVIPTAGEVPILQTLFGYGLGSAGGGALMITLPAVSLPSLWMVGKAMPKRNLVVVALIVAVFGVLTGALALLFGLR